MKLRDHGVSSQIKEKIVFQNVMTTKCIISTLNVATHTLLCALISISCSQYIPLFYVNRKKSRMRTR